MRRDGGNLMNYVSLFSGLGVDAQVVFQVVSKEYGEPARAEVSIEEL